MDSSDETSDDDSSTYNQEDNIEDLNMKTKSLLLDAEYEMNNSKIKKLSDIIINTTKLKSLCLNEILTIDKDIDWEIVFYAIEKNTSLIELEINDVGIKDNYINNCLCFLVHILRNKENIQVLTLDIDVMDISFCYIISNLIEVTKSLQQITLANFHQIFQSHIVWDALAINKTLKSIELTIHLDENSMKLFSNIFKTNFTLETVILYWNDKLQWKQHNIEFLLKIIILNTTLTTFQFNYELKAKESKQQLDLLMKTNETFKKEKQTLQSYCDAATDYCSGPDLLMELWYRIVRFRKSEIMM